jgi:hypothetical protein
VRVPAEVVYHPTLLSTDRLHALLFLDLLVHNLCAWYFEKEFGSIICLKGNFVGVEGFVFYLATGEQEKEKE